MDLPLLQQMALDLDVRRHKIEIAEKFKEARKRLIPPLTVQELTQKQPYEAIRASYAPAPRVSSLSHALFGFDLI